MATAQISPGPPGTDAASPPLLPAEEVVARSDGVQLGWQARTVLIWWVPGLVFTVVAYLESGSVVVTALVVLFCAGLFAFYAWDTEVRPRGTRKRYVLTDRRLLIGGVDRSVPWRPVDLDGVAATHMEKALVDRAVARLSGAATIVLELREPGPKGQPRRLRIGPMRQPDAFRAEIDARLPRGD